MIDTMGITPDAVTLSPLKLFMEADLVVKAVMIGLALASIWTWTIIISFGLKIGKIGRANAAFEQDFWKAGDIDAFYKARGHETLPSARVLAAGVGEWRRTTKGKVTDRDGARQRLATAMQSSVGHEIDTLSDRLNFLATVGSVAPFVGLFGTVWGIMRSFTAIAQTQNTTLAVVAPGIAEALFATAIGLAAAIPALIGYNKLQADVGRYGSRLSNFSEEFQALFSRQLDERAA